MALNYKKKIVQDTIEKETVTVKKPIVKRIGSVTKINGETEILTDSYACIYYYDITTGFYEKVIIGTDTNENQNEYS